MALPDDIELMHHACVLIIWPLLLSPMPRHKQIEPGPSPTNFGLPTSLSGQKKILDPSPTQKNRSYSSNGTVIGGIISAQPIKYSNLPMTT